MLSGLVFAIIIILNMYGTFLFRENIKKKDEDGFNLSYSCPYQVTKQQVEAELS